MSVLYAGTDPCTDQILDFIAGGVPGNRWGESGGNYNAVIGDARASDDLSLYTLSGIYALQDSLVARGRPSTAIGRYQFLKGTLRELQEQRGLPNSARFTPGLQDMLALDLLIRRGYRRWWRGEITDREFAHNLSLEWASLPDPENDPNPNIADDELSHYAGDRAGNSHSTTLSAVYAMLNAARAAMPAAAAGTPLTAEGGPMLPPSAPPPDPVPPRRWSIWAAFGRLFSFVGVRNG